MDLKYSQSDLAFRDEVRKFVKGHYPEMLRERVRQGLLAERDVELLWQRALFEKGWAAPNWPVEYGGTGWSKLKRHIFSEELGAAGATKLMPFGLSMLGPVLMEFGTAEQKKYFLPRILRGDDFWCQGYSEPGAGSDLASLRTQAQKDGDHYIVNGTKTWTSFAHQANWIFCLVRTDPNVRKKQEGISFLLIDLKTPGITIRPILTMSGTSDVNEVHFDNVRVPVENRVGAEGEGWTCAKYLLTHERGAAADAARFKFLVSELKKFAGKERAFGKPLIESDVFSRKLATLEIDLDTQEFLELRCLTDDISANIGASIVKLRASQIEQDLSELVLEASGVYGFPFFAEDSVEDYRQETVGPTFARSAAAHFFDCRKTTIFGGTLQIQKNILAKVVFGL